MTDPPDIYDAAEVDRARSMIVEWDEYGQGYDDTSRLVFCICGFLFPLERDHYCPYDEDDEP